MIPALIEAALRALVVALTVWAGLRLFRVSNVLAQKVAWGMVLASALAMPFVMRWQVLPPSMALTVPRHLVPKPLPPQDISRSNAGEMTASHESPLLAKTELVKSEASAKDHGAASDVSGYKANSLDQVRDQRRDQGTTVDGAGPVAASYVDFLHAQNETPDEFVLSRMRGWTAAAVRNAGTLGWLLYLAVCGVLLIRIAFGLNQAMELWQRAEVFVPYPQDDPGFGLRMRFSRAVSSPVTIGSGVLLPYECLEWDAEKLRIVLAHERSHVRQKDFYLQVLAEVYAAVFWFSPLGWWLKRKLSDLSEAISDRAGLEEAASRASYAQVLLEFAALPRPTVAGVAMARTSNLSHRIERFLNESSFRQAFAGSRRRILLAILLVPMAMFAATALIRVEAAASGQAVPPAPPAATAPEPAAVPDAAPAPAAPGSAAQAVEPAPPAQSSAEPPTAGSPAAPAPPAAPRAMVDAIAPAAPVPPPLPPASQYGEMQVAADNRAAAIADEQDESTSTNTTTNSGRRSTSVGRGYSYSYSSNGDTWALITDPSGKVTFSGDWHESTRDSIDKVRKLTNGKFLWFTHGGKSYFIDDAAIVDQIQAMYKPMDDLGKRQEALGKQQEELGRQQEELGRKQEQASIPTPDISKEMAKLNEAVAKLDAKKGSTVSQDELADLEGKLGEIQGRLGELEGEVGAKQGEFGEQQGKLGAEQGKLGAEQGRLGAEQGRIAAEADRKVKSIIDQKLRDGKAKPVE
jgi:BlaR1 peptidase M56